MRPRLAFDGMKLNIAIRKLGRKRPGSRWLSWAESLRGKLRRFTPRYGPPGLQFLRPAGRRYSAGARNWLSILRIYPLIHYSIHPMQRDLRSSTIRYVSQDRNSAQPQGAGTAASVAP